MEDFAVKLFIGIIIAATSAWVTVRLSLARFRTEKWWEKKVASYEKVIEAFYNSKQFSSEHLNAIYKSRDLSDSRDEELRKIAKEARSEILRSSDIGAFVLSTTALNILSSYEKETKSLSNSESWFEYIEKDWLITDKYLKLFIVEAKRDIKK